MRKAIALIAGLLVLVFVNFGIVQREQLLTDGRVVLLRLAPVDPRSLMQGDYMRLNFELANQAFLTGRREGRTDGHLVVAVDDRGVAQYRRVADDDALAPGEVKLRYRVRNGEPVFATNAFFFEEGQAAVYADAQYGEFRVGADGDMILTGMRDEQLRPLGVHP